MSGPEERISIDSWFVKSSSTLKRHTYVVASLGCRTGSGTDGPEHGALRASYMEVPRTTLQRTYAPVYVTIRRDKRLPNLDLPTVDVY